ncbi:MAG: Asp23/Gls24 family envelope stress response protein [Candidatus Omnitrophica bacterium]|nr:Asp23/Gls24 family envelope stress response protein [Candidatus Omnitrophota bacterium]
MHRDETRTELGMIKIHKNVIASIASLASMEIEGVKRVGGDFKSGILELIGKKSNLAVKVDIDRNDEVKLDIPLVIKYEYNIPEIANRVQENVRQALEKMTSLSVRDININIQGIDK